MPKPPPWAMPSDPRNAPDQLVVIDLTGPVPRHRVFASTTSGSIAEFVKVYSGVPCSRPSVQNSRTRKPAAFPPPVPPLAPPPQFIQPSKVYHRKNGPSPPVLGRKSSTRRQHIQSSKSDPGKSNSRRDSKPKPYHIDSPQQSQVFPRSRCSDFFPWRGNHAEDRVTDAQARHGQYDKLYVGKGNIEQASARPTLVPSLKSKSALPALSSVILAALERRQRYSRLITPPTFKPPPRVTLPDTRREAWLRDLANPLVPLRRLSRTIPHGLKGPVLLDQCAAKSIPTARALWFARCVGANELRGLRRKGVGSFALGNENKWLREWTVQVSRFLERAISECATPLGLWKQKMLYAIRLSEHFFTENLLDRTLFLEWYLAYLETCPVDMLPAAYLILSIYWRDLLNTRKLGRRLAVALLGKGEAILSAESKDVYVPLVRKLSSLLTDILLWHRESLIIHGSWDLYKPILELCVNTQSFTVRSCLQNISYRNKNLLPAILDEQQRGVSLQRRLISTLDSTSIPFDIGELWQKCCSLGLGNDKLIRCLCQWATTTLRVGVQRVFVVVGLLQRAKESGFDVQDHLIGFMGSFGSNVKGNKRDVYLLVSELVRSKTFSVAAYMKWLISRGILSSYSVINDESPCHVRLLAELPISTLPSHVRNLRKILLSSHGYPVEQEAASLEAARHLLSSKIPGLFPRKSQFIGPTGNFSSDELAILGRLSRTVLSDLGSWIMESARMHVVRGQPVGRNNWRDVPVEIGITALTTEEFIAIRQVLEHCQDFQMLSEVARMVTSSHNSVMLSCVADTISHNIEVFSALGTVSENLQLLFDQYKKLQGRRIQEKNLVTSLVDLASFPGPYEEIRRDLGQYLASFEKRFAKSAATQLPLPDRTAQPFERRGVDNLDEIDRLLTLGSSIDKGNFVRLFETLIPRAEPPFDGRGAAGFTNTVTYLARLRQLDARTFDELMCGWVTRLLQSPGRPSLLHVFSTLVAGSCLEIDVIVRATLCALKPRGKIKMANNLSGEIAAQALDTIVNDGSSGAKLTPQQCYRLKRKRKLFLSRSGIKFVRFLRKSIMICVATLNPTIKTRLRNLILSPPVLEFLRGVAVAQPKVLVSGIVRPLSKAGDVSLLQWLHVLIDHLLDDHETGDLDPEVQVTHLIQFANDFSIGLCQLKLRIIFDAENKYVMIDEYDDPSGSENPLMKAFFHGIASTFKDRVDIWTDLVSALDQESAYRIRGYAEGLVVNSSTFPPVRLCLGPLEPSLVQGRESGETLARALLSLIEATAYSIPKHGILSAATMLVDKLNMIIQSITLQDDELEQAGNSVPEIFWNDSPVESRCWLLLFLRMITLHRSSFATSKSTASDQGRMVVGLCTLLQHRFVEQDEDLFHFVFDVTCSFIDDINDDSRLQIRRFARGKRPTERVSYLLDTAEAPSGGLKATLRERLIDYQVKPWERLAEPSPVIGENDTSISMTLFKTRRVRCGKDGRLR